MGRVTQAHIDARTKDILDSAVRLFARSGVEGTTMQEIAAEAGISAGAIYHYYPSKEHLVRAVFEDCSRGSREAFQRGAAGTETPLGALRQTGEIAWESIKHADGNEQTILGLEMALAGARRPEEFGPNRRELMRSTVDMLEATIRDAQRQGELDSAVDARAFALMLMASYLGSRVLALDLGGEVDTGRVRDMAMFLIDAFSGAKARVAAL